MAIYLHSTTFGVDQLSVLFGFFGCSGGTLSWTQFILVQYISSLLLLMSLSTFLLFLGHSCGREIQRLTLLFRFRWCLYWWGMMTSVSPGKTSSGFNSTKSHKPLYPSMMEHSDSLWLKWVVHTWSFTITAMCMWYMWAKRNKPTSSHLYSGSTTKFRNSC